MTHEQFIVLENWIKAMIDEATDRCDASDGGFIFANRASAYREAAISVLVEKESK